MLPSIVCYIVFYLNVLYKINMISNRINGNILSVNLSIYQLLVEVFESVVWSR